MPIEGKVRIQLNLKVTQAKHIGSVKDFRNIVFPIVWVEEVSSMRDDVGEERKRGKQKKPSNHLDSIIFENCTGNTTLWSCNNQVQR